MNRILCNSILMMVLLTMPMIHMGCSDKRENEEESVEEVLNLEQPEEIYEFVDVKGVKYEAPLL